MNRHNIISAGWMMAIVVMLLGAFHCGATVAGRAIATNVAWPGIAGIALFWSVVLGASLVVCGLALVVMFSFAAREPRLGTPVLAVGAVTALLGSVAAFVEWYNPYSWMMAIVGIAIFIDALCLKISLSQKPPR